MNGQTSILIGKFGDYTMSDLSSEDSVITPSESTFPLESNDDSTDSSVESVSTEQALVLHKKPTLFSFLTSCAINLFLPFIHGMMLGFGEIFAQELGFRWGWSGARVGCFPWDG